MEKNTSINPYYAIVAAIAVIVVLVYLLFGTYLWGSARKEIHVTCASFQTQQQAQKVYDGDRKQFAGLSKVNRYGVQDGIACSDLPKV